MSEGNKRTAPGWLSSRWYLNPTATMDRKCPPVVLVEYGSHVPLWDLNEDPGEWKVTGTSTIIRAHPYHRMMSLIRLTTYSKGGAGYSIGVDYWAGHLSLDPRRNLHWLVDATSNKSASRHTSLLIVSYNLGSKSQRMRDAQRAFRGKTRTRTVSGMRRIETKAARPGPVVP